MANLHHQPRTRRERQRLARATLVHAAGCIYRPRCAACGILTSDIVQRSDPPVSVPRSLRNKLGRWA
jgi:hypothetical protein